MTRYELYVKTWKDCGLCHYARTRKRVVLGRADELPCDVLFVGEAPGESEDVHGIPFFGQAGMLLDEIIRKGVPEGVSVAINNLTGCIPIDGGEKGEPDYDCVKACSPRLKQFVDLANPKLLVTVGKHSTEWLDQTWKEAIQLPSGLPQVSIVHPAAILRQPYVNRELSVQHCIVTVRNAVRKHVLEPRGKLQHARTERK